MNRINLGSGMDYRKGWINVDNNSSIKADVYSDFENGLPFQDNYADEILLDNVVEHITPARFFFFIEELHRISKPGCKITIYVPHYSGMYALKHLAHYKYFGIGSFDVFRPEPTFNGERYSDARFKLVSEKLLFFHHKLIGFSFLSKLPINWLFNCSKAWQLIMEKFQFFGFDEIAFSLETVK